MPHTLSVSPREILKIPKQRLVIKVGSALLAQPRTQLFSKLAKQIILAQSAGHQVVVVSSGAVALGRPLLGFTERPKKLPQLQAAAALGQPLLLAKWQRALLKHTRYTAQVLVTHADFTDSQRATHIIHTLNELLCRQIVPIINENDSVATEEITFGDNDCLAAELAKLINADLLLLLTTVDGLYSQNPFTHKNARHISVVHHLDEVIHMAGRVDSADIGTGGMRSKIVAAERATRAGITSIIAHGGTKNILQKILDGDCVGTIFPAKRSA